MMCSFRQAALKPREGAVKYNVASMHDQENRGKGLFFNQRGTWGSHHLQEIGYFSTNTVGVWSKFFAQMLV